MGGRVTPILLLSGKPFPLFPLPGVFVEPDWLLLLLRTIWTGPGEECDERIAGRVSPIILLSILYPVLGPCPPLDVELSSRPRS